MSFKTPKGTILRIDNLKGKDYLPANQRILWFREEHPDWCIETTPVKLDKDLSIFKCEITNAEGKLICTAHKSETPTGFRNHVEKAETGSISRALALCGYGTQFTGDEFEEGESLADTPISREIAKAADAFGHPPPLSRAIGGLTSPNAEFPKCPIHGTKMLKSKFPTGPQFYCIECSKEKKKPKEEPQLF